MPCFWAKKKKRRPNIKHTIGKNRIRMRKLGLAAMPVRRSYKRIKKEFERSLWLRTGSNPRRLIYPKQHSFFDFMFVL